MKSVCVVTPCYGGVVEHTYFLESHRAVMMRPDQPVNWLLTSGDSLITRARNNAIPQFLDSGCDTMALIDSDIELKAEDFWKLVDMDQPIRGAAVSLKTVDRKERLSCYYKGHRMRRADMPQKPFPCEFLGAAVLFIDREVIEKVKAHPQVMPYECEGIGQSWAMFEAGVTPNGAYLSEDYTFCHLARESGFEIWCDPTVVVNHYGRGVWRA